MPVKHSGDEPIGSIVAALFGKPKIGKSSFFSTWPDPLVIDVDRAAEKCSTMRIASTPYIEVTNTEQMNEALEEAAKPEYKSVAIDSLTLWTHYQVEEIARNNGRELPEPDDWQLLIFRIRELFQICKGLKKHVLFIAHPWRDKDEKKGKMYGSIALAGKQSEKFLMIELDDIWYMESMIEQNERGEEIESRYIYTRPHDIFTAGSRLGLPSKIGPNPTWADIESVLAPKSVQTASVKNGSKKIKKG